MGRFSARFAGRDAAGTPGFGEMTFHAKGLARLHGRGFRRARLFYNPGCAFGALLR